MSSIYSWDQSETNLTSTTTSVTAASDAVLIHSVGDSRKRQTTLQNAGQAWALPVTTSTSTATLVPNRGTFVLTSASSAQFFLSTPTGTGQMVVVFNTTTTSTANWLTTNSTASAVFISTETSSGMSLNFQSGAGTGAGGCIIMSNSAGKWMVVSRAGGSATLTVT